MDDVMQEFNPAREIETRLKRLSSGIPGSTTVAVMAGGCLLMGKRRDSGKWTLPGGGMNDGELPLQGALRELREEAGIDAPGLQLLGSDIIKGRSGREVCIYCYRLDTQRRATSTAQDPDQEVNAWEWVDVTGGLPDAIKGNLHSPKNLLLAKLGLL